MMDISNAAPKTALETLESARQSSDEARMLHRLHCVVLVEAGWASQEVASVFGADSRTVQRWVMRFKLGGYEALRDRERVGRPHALSDAEKALVERWLSQPPSDIGHAATAWSGSLLQAQILRAVGVKLSARHCQRLLARSSKKGLQ